jgi:hypothetical protein
MLTIPSLKTGALFEELVSEFSNCEPASERSPLVEIGDGALCIESDWEWDPVDGGRMDLVSEAGGADLVFGGGEAGGANWRVPDLTLTKYASKS